MEKNESPSNTFQSYDYYKHPKRILFVILAVCLATFATAGIANSDLSSSIVMLGQHQRNSQSAFMNLRQNPPSRVRKSQDIQEHDNYHGAPSGFRTP
jgi:hypothetical protein